MLRMPSEIEFFHNPFIQVGSQNVGYLMMKKKEDLTLSPQPPLSAGVQKRMLPLMLRYGCKAVG